MHTKARRFGSENEAIYQVYGNQWDLKFFQ